MTYADPRRLGVRIMIKHFAVATFLYAASNSIVIGQTINLVCRGQVIKYNPTIEALTEGAATIDLDQNSLTTSLGEFHIINVGDTSINFNGTENSLVVFGTLDRITGKMTVFWYTPEDWAKVQAYQDAHFSRHAQLTCSASKKLF
jgi:hypothetical protein